MLKQTINPGIYKEYCSRMLKHKVNYFFNRFETYTYNLPSVSLSTLLELLIIVTETTQSPDTLLQL